MATFKFPKETVVDTWGFPHDPDEEIGAKVIRNKVTGSGRWQKYHQIIVTLPGHEGLFSADYSAGLTECQEERPWEFDKEVTFTEVEEYERAVKDFRVKK